jgi:hypothetical protein
MGKKLPRCRVGRCTRIARIGDWCPSHATDRADTIFSLQTRQHGTCYGVMKFWTGPKVRCGGPLQCAHLFSRRYRNVRWDHRNAVPLCAGHHWYFDNHPIEKDDIMLEWLEMDYELLRREALEHGHWREKLVEFLEKHGTTTQKAA